MKNTIAKGDRIPFVTAGAVAAGAPVLVGAILGVAETAATAAGQTIIVALVGVFSVPKIGSQAWTVGAAVYWDAGNSRFTTVVTGAIRGVAFAAVGAGAGETTGQVRLQGAAA